MEIIDFHELMWAIINFTVFFLILRWLFYKPLMGLLAERREEVQSNLADAETARQDAQQMREEYETRLQTARREAQDILRKAQEQAEESATSIIDNARKEAETQRIRAQEQIKEEKEAAIRALRQEVAELVVMTAGRFLRHEMTDEDHLRLAQEFVAEMEEVGELN